jgi:hypothetical protein
MNQQVEADFDYDGIVLRRADPDDLEAILNLVEIGEEDIFGRVYSYPNVLKLIETAYLSITAIDRDGNIIAFAAFEDYPLVSAETGVAEVSAWCSLPLEREPAAQILMCAFPLDYFAGHVRRCPLQLLGGLVPEDVQY